MTFDYDKDSKERIPYSHYCELFAQADPLEISVRCNTQYDEDKKEFRLILMGDVITVKHPEGIFYDAQGNVITDYSVMILLLRYLCENSYVRSSGNLLHYTQIPWGEVYFKNFEGRCIKRLAFGFGYDLEKFSAAMQKIPSEKMDMGDCAYSFEFLGGLKMVFILWGQDEEFPPSAQILFEDNFPSAFSAEDAAFAGDISISKIKKLSQS